MASWSRHEGRVVITGSSDTAVDAFPVSHYGDRPGTNMLASSEWCVYPGTQWQEEPPGQWTVAVFSFQRLPSAGTTGSDTGRKR